MEFLEVTEAGNIIANSFEPILFEPANNMFWSSEVNWASYQMEEIMQVLKIMRRADDNENDVHIISIPL